MKNILKLLSYFKVPAVFGSNIVPRGRYTYEKFIVNANAELKHYTKKDFTAKLTQDEINLCLMEYWALAGMKDDPYYQDSDVIPKIAQVISNQAAGASFNATGRVLTIPASGSGITWSGATAFNSSFVGAPVRLEVISEFSGGDVDAVNAPSNIYNTTVESVTNGTTVVLVSTAIPSISGAVLKVTVTATSEQDQVDLSALDNWKSMQEIIKVTSAVGGLCVPVDSREFTYLQGLSAAASNYSGSVVYYQSGAFLFFLKGGDLANYGNRVIEYIRLPRYSTVITDYIDIPDQNTRMLMDMVEIKMIQTLEDQPMPQELLGTQNKLKEMRAATNEVRFKLREGKK